MQTVPATTCKVKCYCRSTWVHVSADQPIKSRTLNLILKQNFILTHMKLKSRMLHWRTYYNKRMRANITRSYDPLIYGLKITPCHNQVWLPQEQQYAEKENLVITHNYNYVTIMSAGVYLAVLLQYRNKKKCQFFQTHFSKTLIISEVIKRVQKPFAT